jgi:ketosteroid isomerase-like protein
MIFRLIQILLILSFLVLSNAWAQTANKNDSQTERDQRELIRLTNEISRASVKRNLATLKRLMDDNFVMFGVGNKSFGKAALIKLWTTKDSDSTASSTSTPSDFQVYLYGDTAIVFNTITDTERRSDGETTTQTKAFDVWKKTKKGWRWIASRETLLMPPDKKEQK